MNFLRLHTSEPFSPNLRISFRFGSPQASNCAMDKKNSNQKLNSIP